MLLRATKNNSFKYLLILILSFNLFLFFSASKDTFDQIINILSSIGIFEYFKNRKLIKKFEVPLINIVLSFFILTFILFRLFLVFSLDDKFVYFALFFLLISFLLINISIKNIGAYFKPILMSLFLPLKEVLYIPISIILTPISTGFTWFTLNIFGFRAYTRGQEIFIGNGGVDITFGCSGSDQIIFSIASVIVLYFLLPFKNLSTFYIQSILSLIVTFLINILRLCILAITVESYNSDKFSVFDFFHGNKGSLVFALISTVICCEIYKRLYFLERLKS